MHEHAVLVVCLLFKPHLRSLCENVHSTVASPFPDWVTLTPRPVRCTLGHYPGIPLRPGTLEEATNTGRLAVEQVVGWAKGLATPPPADSCGHAYSRKGGMVWEKRLGHSPFSGVAGSLPGVAGRPARSRRFNRGQPFRNHGHAHRGQTPAWTLCHLPHHWPRSLPHADGHDCHQ